MQNLWDASHNMVDVAYLQTCLYDTILEWRQVHVTSRDNLLCYGIFRETKFSLSFMNILGKKLLRKPLSVLDVGSGKSQTAVTLVGHAAIDKYHSIDRAFGSSRLDHRSLRSSDIKHFKRDVFDEDCTKDMHPHSYDVIIIDIEPHGNESSIYKRLQPLLRTAHICILKCIGDIDLHGSSMADCFLERFIKDGHVYDFFAETSLNPGYRDIYVIMTRQPTKLEKRCQRLASGEVHAMIAEGGRRLPAWVLHNHEKNSVFDEEYEKAAEEYRKAHGSFRASSSVVPCSTVGKDCTRTARSIPVQAVRTSS